MLIKFSFCSFPMVMSSSMHFIMCYFRFIPVLIRVWSASLVILSWRLWWNVWIKHTHVLLRDVCSAGWVVHNATSHLIVVSMASLHLLGWEPANIDALARRALIPTHPAITIPIRRFPQRWFCCFGIHFYRRWITGANFVKQSAHLVLVLPSMRHEVDTTLAQSAAPHVPASSGCTHGSLLLRHHLASLSSHGITLRLSMFPLHLLLQLTLSLGMYLLQVFGNPISAS